ncbi:MAG: PD40 domain-containing protein [Salinivirgaceae bacterium]|nr:PD40 domain-containing protein [Salinivirgaceae bacterium]
MRRLSIITIIALLLPFAAVSQDVREANYQFKIENYQVALKMYLNAYKRDTGNADINYGIGVCRTKTNAAPDKALPHLLKAESKYGQEADYLLALAKAYFFNYKFDKARETLNKATVKLKGNAEADRLKIHIDNAEKMVKSPLNVTFVNLGKGINSDMDEITPMLTPDNEIMVYSSNRKYDTSLKEYMWDVQYSNSESGDFKKTKAATAFNTVEDEMVAGLSLNGFEMYFYQDAYGIDRDLLISTIEAGGFKGKTQLPPSINTKGMEKSAYSTWTGDTLIFASDGHGGEGGFDLFYTVRLPNGDWCQPTSLGKTVNSQYDELYPMLSTDGKKLYFCSNGTKSMGGFDVFVCSIDLKTLKVGEPRNIGYPLNDVYDNFTISYTNDGNYAYVSATKPDSYGYTDIYRVVFNDKDPMVKLYIVKLQIAQGENKVDFAETETDLKVSVLTKGKTLFGTYNYNPATSSVNVALLPGDYVLEIEGNTIEPFSMKISAPNGPGKKIENLKAVVKLKK